MDKVTKCWEKQSGLGHGLGYIKKLKEKKKQSYSFSGIALSKLAFKHSAPNSVLYNSVVLSGQFNSGIFPV